MLVCAAFAAARFSGSPHIANVGAVVALLWCSNIALHFLDPNEVEAWQIASLDLIALTYFYRRWSAPQAQHRQFHFLLMCSYLTTTAFFTYQLALARLAPEALLLSEWWFAFFSNRLFELELLGITAYALLFRRAKANKAKFRADTRRWLARSRIVK